MKNSMKYVAISIVMIFVVLLFTMVRSYASGSSIIIGGTTGNNNANNTNITNITNNLNTNNARPVNNAEEKENLTKVNQINDAEKDIPQTGETDVYIVGGIAVITIAVGAFAFIKSRKYNV